ncbi:heparan N-sulfatase [Wenyingzhuangia fucanilytica]|uniref:Heparan N-sulfatase n=1 Tax=Wenyingzhuangia fucanilytica TaxID=1790137 RepID=A0A1B1Y661_9FLAO|nr:sulfatase [Wenyingzhuangia fucanilytica]ANW96237.1 heparan N-sulfatase [Wenyingzhuangia fucanilytica]
MKKIIKSLIFVGFSSCLLLACESSKKTEVKQKKTSKPNVILFVSDDHGKDALGCYGNPVIQTPNLDKMASEGVLFNNAYCTSASCAASRSVILTGKYGHATGSYGHVHDYHHFSTYDNEKSLPVLLEENGYETARIGKYHVAPEKVYHFNTVLEADPRNTVEMADACVEVLNTDKPFFLYFCTDDPHRGAPFESTPWNKPNNFGNKKGGYKGVNEIVYDPEKVLVPSFLPDTKETREEIAQYYQSISRIDQGFGKLMQYLKEAGKIDNTIVIYISDNGMAFPGAKTTVYEPGIQLPCIIKDPFKNKHGAVNNAKISWVDLTPTILDMTGVVYNSKDFHGKSFNKIIDEENPKGWDQIYASHTFHEITMYYPMRVVIDKNYKLIWNIAWPLEYPFASDLWAASTWQSSYRNHSKTFGERNIDDFLYRAEFELYDLDKDPGEVKNLSKDPEFDDVLNRMKKELQGFQKITQDPWFIMWNHDSSLQGAGVEL